MRLAGATRAQARGVNNSRIGSDGWLARFFKCLLYPTRISSTIKDPKDDCFVSDYPVINGKREALCEQPMESKMNAMYTGIEDQRIYV
jgi:hypothetical protein